MNFKRFNFALIALLFTILIAGVAELTAVAQFRNINQAQDRIRERMIREQGGNRPSVQFNDNGDFSQVDSNNTRVNGSGTYYRDRNDSGRYFTYEAIFNINNGDLRRLNYNFNSGGGSGGGGGSGQIVYCASDDGRRNYCAANTRGGVRLINQKSGSPCNQGSTWGFDRDRIWVDRGCRADFEVGSGGGGGGNWNGGGGGFGQLVYCASDDGRRNYCAANTRGGVRLVNQKSGSPCNQGSTWGYDRDRIWVDRGCRAEFEVGNSGGGGGGGGNWNGGGNRPNGNVIYSGPIINRGSRKALDVAEGSQRDGANIQQWGFADQPNQNWQVINVGNGEVALIAQHSGKALTVQGGRENNGANVIQRSWNAGRQQRWRLQRLGDDWVAIISVDTGKCLDVTDQSRSDGANIQQWQYANQDNQKWRLRRP